MTRLIQLRYPRDHNSAKASTKSPGDAGALVPGISKKSVLPDDRTAQVEAVVDASGDEVHILADRVSAEYAADRYDRGTQNTCRREAATIVTHEQVIVLDRNRPIRRKSEFEARSDDTTPACITRRIEQRACGGYRASVFVVGHGGAALHIPKDVVPGIPDLAGEKAERFNPGIVSPGGNETANVRSVQISPVALRFETEHPTGGLPAVTNLTANHSAGRIVTTFAEGGQDSYAGEVRNIPALVARSPTAVGSDIEAAPVVDRSHHRRRLGVGTCSQISGRRGSSHG